MSMRDDLEQTKAGKAYLETLLEITREASFSSVVMTLAADKALKDQDPHLSKDAKRALGGDENARLKVAEALLQTRLEPERHKLFPERNDG